MVYSSLLPTPNNICPSVTKEWLELRVQLSAGMPAFMIFGSYSGKTNLLIGKEKERLIYKLVE